MSAAKGPPKGSKKPPKLLVAMRRVWRTPKESDETEEHKRLRAVLEKDAQKFMSEMNKLESEFRSRKDRALAGIEARKAERQEDAGTDRLVELMDQLLAGWEAADAEG